MQPRTALLDWEDGVVLPLFEGWTKKEVLCFIAFASWMDEWMTGNAIYWEIVHEPAKAKVIKTKTNIAIQKLVKLRKNSNVTYIYCWVLTTDVADPLSRSSRIDVYYTWFFMNNRNMGSCQLGRYIAFVCCWSKTNDYLQI